MRVCCSCCWVVQEQRRVRQGCTLMLQHRMTHKRLVLSATAFETGLGLGMCFLPMHGTSAADQAAGIAMERAGSCISCRQADGPHKCGQGLPPQGALFRLFFLSHLESTHFDTYLQDAGPRELVLNCVSSLMRDRRTRHGLFIPLSSSTEESLFYREWPGLLPHFQQWWVHP